MKKTKISATLAAAAAILCLCGVLFFFFIESHSPTSSDTQKENAKAKFSLDDAEEYLSLCSVSYQPETLQKSLQDRGVTDFKYCVRDQYSSSGSGIAFGIGIRKGSEPTVTAVFRGTNKGEWYSNFSIGENTEHAGFSAAADFALEEVEKYLLNQGVEKSSVNIVITGHSRGGAVANILAKRLIEQGGYLSVTAYTFASPNTTTSTDAHSPAYQSIFNIVNPEDFICYIPLESWGFTKYGINIELPGEETENFGQLYSEMEKVFLSRAGYKHRGYQNHHKDVQAFLSAAENIAPTVQDYYNHEVTAVPHRVTLYEYMNKVAALLSDENPIANGMFLMSSSNSPEFKAITDFMMQGIDIEDIAESRDITGSAINSGHTYETYAAWMEVLDDNYFKDIIESEKQ